MVRDAGGKGGTMAFRSIHRLESGSADPGISGASHCGKHGAASLSNALNIASQPLLSDVNKVRWQEVKR